MHDKTIYVLRKTGHYDIIYHKDASYPTKMQGKDEEFEKIVGEQVRAIEK